MGKSKKSKQSKSTNTVLIVCAVTAIAAILIPPFVNYLFIIGQYKTGAELGNTEWLGFWGSYLGSLIGSIAALSALYLTFRQQEMHHATTKEFDRLRALPSINASVLPLGEHLPNLLNSLVIRKNGEIEYYVCSNKDQFNSLLDENRINSDLLVIECKGIGAGPAFDVHLFVNTSRDNPHHETFGNIGVGDSIIFLAIIPRDWSFDIVFEFKDIFSNRYSQTFSLCSSNDNTCVFTNPSTPLLIQRSNIDTICD